MRLFLGIACVLFLIVATLVGTVAGICGAGLCSPTQADLPSVNSLSQTWAPSSVLFRNVSYGPYGQDLKASVLDFLGVSLALSGNGTVVVAGGKGRSIPAGYVQAWRYEVDQWVEHGQQLKASTQDDYFGDAVSISSDGRHLVVGAPSRGDTCGIVSMYYMNSSFAWEAISTDGRCLMGSGVDELGSSVAIGGDVYAIGAPFSSDSDGYVCIFRRRGLNRVEFEAKLSGQTFTFGFGGSSEFGRSISLSDDGSTIAIGGTHYGTQQQEKTGRVVIYRHSDGEWKPLGQPLIGDKPFDYFGRSIALSRDGKCVSIGADQRPSGFLENAAQNLTKFGPGYVRSFCFDGFGWISKGDLIGGSDGDKFGLSLAVSSDWTRMAVLSAVGRMHIFAAEHECQWKEVVEHVVGQPTLHQRTLAMSSDGSTIAVSAIPNGGEGYVRLYRLR